MKTIATILILGFVGIVFLGFLPMDHHVHSEMFSTSCPVISAFNAECVDGFLMALMHIALVGSLLGAPVAPILMTAVLLCVLVILFLILGTHASAKFVRRLAPVRTDDIPARYKLRRWLALFEHSPSIA
jgi:hypothetical protein